MSDESTGEWAPWHEAQGSYIPQSVCDAHNAALAAEKEKVKALSGEVDGYCWVEESQVQKLRSQVQTLVEDCDILESYPDDLPEKAKGHRHWGRMSWLYPGDIVCQISGKSAELIKTALEKGE